jgi:hypothetical protein
MLAGWSMPLPSIVVRTLHRDHDGEDAYILVRQWALQLIKLKEDKSIKVAYCEVQLGDMLRHATYNQKNHNPCLYLPRH